MSKLHLAAGSQQPPKVDGKLRLYSMEYCPYAQRPRLVLNAKNIPHDIVNINLLDKPDWYFKIHPEGIVPALDTGSEIVIESLVISDFLEEKYPKPALYPANPEAKKRDQELIEKIDPLLSVFFLCLWKKDLKTPEEWVEEFVPHLEVFESELGSRGTPFFGGSKPGMVDYMLWPWGERKDLIVVAFGKKLPCEKNKFTLLEKWYQAMLQDPPCKATHNDIEQHWKVVQQKIKSLESKL
ncbi:pyrimidodiazepine synthase-like isoform X2 [Zophobas morio]